MRTLIFILFWVLSGNYFAWTDWTSKHDTTVREAVIITMAGTFAGPVMAVTLLERCGPLDRVIIKKRGETKP